MAHRKDALAASAEWMVMIESTTLQHGGNLVATVGELRCLPGAVNVIPGEVALSLDIRGPQDAPLDVLLNTLLAQAQTIATRRGLSFSAEEFYRIAATPCDAHLQTRLGEAVAAVQGRTVSLPSGAGHVLLLKCLWRKHYRNVSIKRKPGTNWILMRQEVCYGITTGYSR